MKLYYSKGACSLAVRIILNELHLDIETVSVDLKTKKTESGQDYNKINPKSAVPALLTDDNELLTENAVIQQYLADTQKAHQLLPPLANFNRYRVLEWLNFVSTDLHKNFGPLFNPSIPADIKNNIFIPLLKRKFNMVEKNLQNKSFLAGDQFTLPDAYLFVMLLWAEKMKIDMQDMPKLTQYFNALKKRESIVTALHDEHLTTA